MRELDRRLRRIILVLSVISIAALAVTESEGWYLAAAVATAVVSWHTVERGRVAVPRWVISLGLSAALAWALVEIMVFHVSPVPALGRCFVYFQIIKYFQTKTGREIGEMIVLSVMVVMTAAALSADAVFALLLVAYLIVGVRAVYLYTLKRDAEGIAERQVRAGLAANADEAWAGRVSAPARLRLGKATLGGLAVMLTSASVVFALMPRLGPPETAGGGAVIRQPIAITGFSEQISLGDVTRLLESDQQVMRVAFRKGDQPYRFEDDEANRMRGSTLLLYGQGQWSALPGYTSGMDMIPLEHDAYQPVVRLSAPAPGLLEQEIWLEPIASDVLFAAYVPVALRSEQVQKLRFHKSFDYGVRHAEESMPGTLRYHVLSVDASDPAIAANMRRTAEECEYLADAILERSEIPPAVARLARQWVGPDPARPFDRWALALSRAKLIEERLRDSGEYLYSTEIDDIDSSVDPIEDFLVRRKTGYCEYFAGAMALMCQSLGIPARLVNGFKQGQYNPMGQFYTFQLNDAHSWVEVLTPDRGWTPFDPTPALPPRPPAAVVGTLRQYANYLQHNWNKQVIGFGMGQYDSLRARMDIQWREIRMGAENVGRRWFEAMASLAGRRSEGGEGDRGAIVTVAAVVFTVAVLGAMGGLAYWLVRRRLGRARQAARRHPTVEFYERIAKLLAARGHVRGPAQTHREFVAGVLQSSATRLPPSLRDAAAWFYQVRFGNRPLSQQQEWVVESLTAALQRPEKTGSGG